jgi:hypothetical protein
VKSSVQLVVVALGAVVLVIGAFFGLRPITAEVTQVSPEIRTLQLSCGIGYLPGVPATGDPVELPGEPGTFLPRANYAEHCDLAISYQPYLAWALTVLGLLGLALLYFGRRNRVGVWPAS